MATTARYPIPAGSGVKRNWETQRKAGISTKTPTWHYAWPNLSRDPFGIQLGIAPMQMAKWILGQVRNNLHCAVMATLE